MVLHRASFHKKTLAIYVTGNPILQRFLGSALDVSPTVNPNCSAFLLILCWCRYMQVGNAVAVPVATALGYALGQSFLQKVAVQEETLELPREFPYCLTLPTAPNLPTTA